MYVDLLTSEFLFHIYSILWKTSIGSQALYILFWKPLCFLKYLRLDPSICNLIVLWQEEWFKNKIDPFFCHWINTPIKCTATKNYGWKEFTKVCLAFTAASAKHGVVIYKNKCHETAIQYFSMKIRGCLK